MHGREPMACARKTSEIVDGKNACGGVAEACSAVLAQEITRGIKLMASASWLWATSVKTLAPIGNRVERLKRGEMSAVYCRGRQAWRRGGLRDSIFSFYHRNNNFIAFGAPRSISEKHGIPAAAVWPSARQPRSPSIVCRGMREARACLASP